MTQSRSEKPKGSKGTVLVVDDELAVLRTLSRALTLAAGLDGGTTAAITLPAYVENEEREDDDTDSGR